MGIITRGDNLIFLVSQPRAGSTMLQRMLAVHPEIHTTGEPWLMLHPLYALRQSGHTAEFSAKRASQALRSFLDELPRAEDSYFDAVALMATHLYDQSRTVTGKRLFLDKTPRYYLILPELVRTFPRARYLILLRNPLAVLASILRTWVREWPLKLARFRDDLLEAPSLLLGGIELLGDKGLVVAYERLVEDPETQMRAISAYLGISFAPEMIEYGVGNLPRWSFGDTCTVYEHAQPDKGRAEAWQLQLGDPQIWRFLRDYQVALGPRTIEALGYSYEALARVMGETRPPLWQRGLALPLGSALGHPEETPTYWEHMVALLRASCVSRSMRKAALRHTLRRVGA